MQEQVIQFSQEDLEALLLHNPLAKEQLLRISAQRQGAELRAELALLRNGGGGETNETPEEVVAETED
jgi:hypothetical protein